MEQEYQGRLKSRVNNPPSWERPVQWPETGLPFDLRAVRYVLAAAELLSFSKVALALDIKVSTVSRSIRDLEDSIGVSLFERTTMGVRLTDAGSRFLDDILPAIFQIENAIHHAGSAGRVEEGVVRIGILTTLAGGFLRDLIAGYRQEFDGVQLQIRDGGRREHLRAIRARDLDIAFFTGNGAIEDCDLLELWQERVHVAIPAAHPLAREPELDWPQLKGERFIVPSQEPGPEVHDYIIRRIADYSTYPDIGFRPVLLETLMHLVAMGEGITLVSEGWTHMVCPALVMRPLTAAEDIVPMSVVWSPQNDNPAMRRFISFAQSFRRQWRRAVAAGG